MAYIEIVGIACSGKTYFKNKISKKYKKNNEKEIIINDYINHNKLNFFGRLKCNLLLYSYNNKIRYIKSIFKKDVIYTDKGNQIKFDKPKKNFLLKIFDRFKLNDLYLKLLYEQKIIYKIEEIKIYQSLMKIIDEVDQSEIFKNNLKHAILNNILTIEILKKNFNINFIADEGLLYRIFLACKLTKNLKSSLNQVLFDYVKFGEVIILDKSVSEIWDRSELRRKNKSGYIYKNKDEIYDELKNFDIFKSMFKNKVDIVIQNNIK